MGVVLAGAEPLLMLGEREQGSQSERAVRLLGLRRNGPAQAKSLLLSYTKAGASLVLIETAAEDETRKLRRHVAGSCIRCGTSISTAWRRALRCAASARHDYGPLHARTDPATLCGSAREDISREFP